MHVVKVFRHSRYGAFIAPSCDVFVITIRTAAGRLEIKNRNGFSGVIGSRVLVVEANISREAFLCPHHGVRCVLLTHWPRLEIHAFFAVGDGCLQSVESPTIPPIPSAWIAEYLLPLGPTELLKLCHALLARVPVAPRTEPRITVEINKLGEVALLKVFIG